VTAATEINRQRARFSLTAIDHIQLCVLSDPTTSMLTSRARRMNKVVVI
jgi:hypothetical protein